MMRNDLPSSLIAYVRIGAEKRRTSKTIYMLARLGTGATSLIHKLRMV